MHAYFPTIEAAVPLGRARASLADWSLGGHEAVGAPGMQTEAMGCGCAGPLGYVNCVIDIHNRTCPLGFGGFDGIEFPLQLGGFAELHSSPDGAMRSVAAMAATPFIEYYESTLDEAFLQGRAYPFVREVARFYASYLVVDNATQRMVVPESCSQEFCGERQLPPVPFTNSPA